MLVGRLLVLHSYGFCEAGEKFCSRLYLVPILTMLWTATKASEIRRGCGDASLFRSVVCAPSQVFVHPENPSLPLTLHGESRPGYGRGGEGANGGEGQHRQVRLGQERMCGE